MLIEAFKNVDSYTLMSLCDVIFHACLAFKDQAFDLAYNVTPNLVNSFNFTNEEQINSIFSLIGNRTNALNIIECLLSVTNVVKSNIEPFAKEIIQRSINMVIFILGQKVNVQVRLPHILYEEIKEEFLPSFGILE